MEDVMRCDGETVTRYVTWMDVRIRKRRYSKCDFRALVFPIKLAWIRSFQWIWLNSWLNLEPAKIEPISTNEFPAHRISFLKNYLMIAIIIKYSWILCKIKWNFSESSLSCRNGNNHMESDSEFLEIQLEMRWGRGDCMGIFDSLSDMLAWNSLKFMNR